MLLCKFEWTLVLLVQRWVAALMLRVETLSC